MAPAYERVSRSDHGPKKSTFDQRKDFVMRKFWAVVWVGFAAFVANFVDLWHEITVDRPVHGLHRGYFKLGLFCFGMWTVVAAYLVIWVKYILKVEEEWEDYAPKAIPIATCLGLVGIISFIIAFWPVWGFLSLPIIFVFFMGMLHLAHFVPL